jgi:hypothetical protein
MFSVVFITSSVALNYDDDYDDNDDQMIIMII